MLLFGQFPLFLPTHSAASILSLEVGVSAYRAAASCAVFYPMCIRCLRLRYYYITDEISTHAGLIDAGPFMGFHLHGARPEHRRHPGG